MKIILWLKTRTTTFFFLICTRTLLWDLEIEKILELKMKGFTKLLKHERGGFEFYILLFSCWCHMGMGGIGLLGEIKKP